MFLQWKGTDIYQCHSGSIAFAMELLAVNSEIVKISFLFLSRQAGLRFLIPWFCTWINSFLCDQWGCICFQKLSDCTPGRLPHEVVLQTKKKIRSHTRPSWITRQWKQLLWGGYLTLTVVMLICMASWNSRLGFCKLEKQLHLDREWKTHDQQGRQAGKKHRLTLKKN